MDEEDKQAPLLQRGLCVDCDDAGRKVGERWGTQLIKPDGTCERCGSSSVIRPGAIRTLRRLLQADQEIENEFVSWGHFRRLEGKEK